jgi:predicted permease
MRWIDRVVSALRAVLRCRRVEEELDAELQFHLEQQIEENIAAGMTAADAQVAAQRSADNLASVRERCRESLGVRLFDELGQDIRYAIRTLRRSPGFAAAAILSMALGIGINTTLFSVTDAVLLEPLPYRHAERLVSVSEYRPGARPALGDSMVSNFTLDAWQRTMRALDGLAPYSGRAYTVTGAGDAEYVRAAALSPDVFRILDVSPVVGRFFNTSEAVGGADRVAVLGYDYWQQRFGGSATALGTSINLDAQPYVIVGVAPRGFSFPGPGVTLYTPFVTLLRTAHGQPNFDLLQALGRLAPGATVAQAEAEGTATARGVGPLPVGADLLLGKGGPESVEVRTMIDALTQTVRPILLLLSAGAVLVLLVGSANVANLFLARGVARARELAVRAALGAGRARIARQLMTESLVIAVVGGTIGGLGAWWLLRLWPALAPRTFPRTGDVRADAVTMLFAVAATGLAGFLAGSVPAFQNRSLRAGLREGARASASVRTTTAHRAFTVAQTACAAVLLIASALLIRSFVRLVRTDPGYDASHVAAARITLQGRAVPASTAARWQQVADNVLQRIRAMPGVEAAGASTMAPFGDVTSLVGFYLSGDRPAPTLAKGLGYIVTPGYAEALHLRLREGRLLRQSDMTSATASMVVNERFAALYLNDGRPVLGRRYRNLLGPNSTAEIVGVVANVLKNGFLDRPQPEFYVAAGNHGAIGIGREINFVIRTIGATPTMTADLRAIVREVDPTDAPAHNITLLTTALSETAGPSRFATAMFGGFAALALCLAAVGLYGLISYGVSQRRREMAVRTALGATRRNLMMLVLKEGLGLTAFGLILGIAMAAGSARLMRTMIVNLSPLDGVSFVVGPLILVVVALTACALPAWRASSLDPLDALRSE